MSRETLPKATQEEPKNFNFIVDRIRKVTNPSLFAKTIGKADKGSRFEVVGTDMLIQEIYLVCQRFENKFQIYIFVMSSYERLFPQES